MCPLSPSIVLRGQFSYFFCFLTRLLFENLPSEVWKSSWWQIFLTKQIWNQNNLTKWARCSDCNRRRGTCLHSLGKCVVSLENHEYTLETKMVKRKKRFHKKTLFCLLRGLPKITSQEGPRPLSSFIYLFWGTGRGMPSPPVKKMSRHLGGGVRGVGVRKCGLVYKQSTILKPTIQYLSRFLQDTTPCIYFTGAGIFCFFVVVVAKIHKMVWQNGLRSQRSFQCRKLENKRHCRSKLILVFFIRVSQFFSSTYIFVWTSLLQPSQTNQGSC